MTEGGRQAFETSTLFFSLREYIYFNNEYDPRIRFINIKANETNSISLYLKIFKKNKFLIEKEHNRVNKIELCNMYPNQNEKYYLYNLDDFIEHSIFYNKLYGDFESYYIFINKISDLDHFINKKQYMKKFDYPIQIKIHTNMKLLTYFKCVNDSPNILDLYNTEKLDLIKDDQDNYFILQNNETKNISYYPYYNNINISLGYMGCELDEDESITIKFSEYEIILDKNKKIKKLNNINIVAKEFIFISNSKKPCIIKLELGQKDKYAIYPLKEYNNTITSEKDIFFVSSNLEEKYHYSIKGSFNMYQYYEVDELYSFHKYLRPAVKNQFDIIEVENSGKFNNNKLAHLIHFKTYRSIFF